ncbi:hypothetical protein [Agrococcus sp. Marseille-Q4369]|uniref:hypothetical protein n=1 Tax=Agrococcus sp. Marseille-Q4369 TaxID=2810513 RepID=UPI001B8D459A|nr:hypothetical protein [Agrococcus sp. Marseille-Q4369]QUW17843.1 hypothetical protein JSQ78_08165 [Agrococcus sp. Marseille-Q4369]
MTDRKFALISATPLAIAPAAAAIAETFPDATVWNLLDDRLLADAQAEGSITEPLAARMDQLIESALGGGADGVILTCSQYGQRALVRDASADGVAVLSADGPLFDEVVALAPHRLLLVASLESAATDSGERLRAAIAAAAGSTEIETLVVPAAANPLTTDALVAALEGAIAEAGGHHDAIVLAQYSLAPAAPALAERFGVVLDGPAAAARRLRATLEAEA